MLTDILYRFSVSNYQNMADLQTLLKDKTPVSFLQEICSRKKLTASYDVLANEGPIHEPVFVMRAQAGDFQGEAD